MFSSIYFIYIIPNILVEFIENVRSVKKISIRPKFPFIIPLLNDFEV